MSPWGCKCFPRADAGQGRPTPSPAPGPSLRRAPRVPKSRPASPRARTARPPSPACRAARGWRLPPGALAFGRRPRALAFTGAPSTAAPERWSDRAEDGGRCACRRKPAGESHAIRTRHAEPHVDDDAALHAVQCKSNHGGVHHAHGRHLHRDAHGGDSIDWAQWHSTAARAHLLVPHPLACCVCFVACRVTTAWRLKHDLNEE